MRSWVKGANYSVTVPKKLIFNLNNTNQRSPVFLLLGSLGWGLLGCSASAQITPDNTLGTQVNTTNGISEISGGTTAASTLFHSFQDFSVTPDNTAFFNNGTEIENIISRVTGGELSNINGLIRANGTANLILINPQGISFGNNASLDLGGSFLGSTASGLVFEDGTVFSTDPTQEPLLTVTAPIGLQLGQAASPIRVNNTTPGGLGVTTGETLALVGNGIFFNGGIIESTSGNIDLGSVTQGQVALINTAGGWNLDYEAVTQFGDLQLLAGSELTNLHDVPNPEGGIQLRGRDITLEQSTVAAQTLAAAPGSNISIQASGTITLGGQDGNGSQISHDVGSAATGTGGDISLVAQTIDIQPNSFIGSTTLGSGNGGQIELEAQEINLTGSGFADFQQNYQLAAFEGTLQPGDRQSGIFAETAGSARSGNIAIETDVLNLREGAIIFSPVFTSGQGGDIAIAAQEIEVNASALQVGGGLLSTNSATLGDINLTTARLSVADGANLINLTFGGAQGGDINIDAQDSINLSNSLLNGLTATGILTNTTFGTGNGGNINIFTQDLLMDGGGTIASNSGAIFAPTREVIPFGGNGGNVNIQASGSVIASGFNADPNNPEISLGSGISTSSFSPANGGDLMINTGKLVIDQGASFASATFNSGNGGQLSLEAGESIEISGITTVRGMQRGGLFASSGSTSDFLNNGAGTAGNISITTPQLLVTNGAALDVQSFGVGNAGNLAISSRDILISNGGNLSGTTVAGTGGDILIETQNFKLDRGLIDASILGSGIGGNIRISAEDSIEIIGSGFAALQSSLFDPNLISPEFLANLTIDQVQDGIVATTIGEGEAGTIQIAAPNIQLRQGGFIATATAGSGSGGSIFLESTDSLIIDSSIVSGSSLFAGQGGDIIINSHRLEVLQGAQITSASLGSGDGGNATINATESILVSGSFSPILPSNISVGVQPLASATGNGGDLQITTPRLFLDGGTISIGSTGTGNAGILEIDSDTIMLDNQAEISADTRSGEGGNIALIADNIFLQGGSATTATSIGTGDGGNITIDATNLVALEGSRIGADAFRGDGGNIRVNAQGLFICETCQITASSQLGVDGVVNIETLEPNTLDLLEIPQQLARPQEIVAVSCPATSSNNSQLVITNRGGLPRRPQEVLSAESMIEFEGTAHGQQEPSNNPFPAPATGWYRNSQGTIVLAAQPANPTANFPHRSLSCRLP